MHARDGAVRIAEGFGKNRDVLETEFLDASLLRRGQFAPERQQRANGFVVVHAESRKKPSACAM